MKKQAENTIVPLWRQRQQLALKYPNTIFLFNINDRYEAVMDDANDLYALFGVNTTRRRDTDNSQLRVFPIAYTDAESTIADIIRSGRKVAVCDRVGKQTQP